MWGEGVQGLWSAEVDAALTEFALCRVMFVVPWACGAMNAAVGWAIARKGTRPGWLFPG